jgi:hypothetical protein
MKLSNHCNYFHSSSSNANLNKQRSHSRSPLTHYYKNYDNENEGEVGDEDDDDDDEEVEEQVISSNKKSDMDTQRKRLSTTSWGKLKHSKSNSSNLGGVDEKQIKTNNVNNNNNYNYNKASKQQNNFKDIPHTSGPVPSLSSPSLFRVFQNSKHLFNTTTSSSDETTNNYSSSYSDHQNQENTINSNGNQRMSRREKMLKPEMSPNTMTTTNVVVNGKKTTSFSQLRQRSLSSHALSQFEPTKYSVENSCVKTTPPTPPSTNTTTPPSIKKVIFSLLLLLLLICKIRIILK